MLVWHGGEVHAPQLQMALGWGGGWAPVSSSGSFEAELRAPLSPALSGQAGTRERCPCFGAGPRGSGAAGTGRGG